MFIFLLLKKLLNIFSLFIIPKIKLPKFSKEICLLIKIIIFSFNSIDKAFIFKTEYI